MNVPENPPATEPVDFERWRVEEELRIKRDELTLKRQELARHRWSSPLVLAVIGLMATILGSALQSYFQNSSARELEQRRFELSLIQKVTDTSDSMEAAYRLKFYVDLGWINDEKRKIADYLAKPSDIPLQPTTTTASNCSDVKDIADCPDEGCGGSYDADLNKRKNIRSDDQQTVVRSIQWIKNLSDPKQFTRSAERLELTELGEGQKITIVAYALAVRKVGRESCNCGLTAAKDTDNMIVLVDPALSQPTLEAAENDSVTAEFTPRTRLDHPNFTQVKLQSLIDRNWKQGETPRKGKLLVRVTGLLMFDSEHFVRNSLRRHNNWEIHPVLKLEYCPEGKACQVGADQNWKNLDSE